MYRAWCLARAPERRCPARGDCLARSARQTEPGTTSWSHAPFDTRVRSAEPVAEAVPGTLVRRYRRSMTAQCAWLPNADELVRNNAEYAAAWADGHLPV